MRILTVADVVVPELTEKPAQHEWDRLDLILSCGDLPPEYLSLLQSVWQVPLFYVRGNHDIRYRSQPPRGCIDLHGRLIRFGGLNFLGLEGSMWYNGGPMQYSERQMRQLLWTLKPTLWWRGAIDIVIAHAPPRGIHDAEDPCHRGFQAYRRLLESHRPRYFIHGHIHRRFQDPTERVTQVEGTRVINTYGYQVMEVHVPTSS